jgi:hypothetical protein
LVDLDVDGDNIKMDPKINKSWGYGMDLTASRRGPVAGFCGHGNEFSGSINDGVFLD